MSQRKQTFTKTNAINIIFTSQVSPILQNVHDENFQCLLEYVIMLQNKNMVHEVSSHFISDYIKKMSAIFSPS